MRILVVTQHFWPENFRINDIVEGFVQDVFTFLAGEQDDALDRSFWARIVRVAKFGAWWHGWSA